MPSGTWLESRTTFELYTDGTTEDVLLYSAGFVRAKAQLTLHEVRPKRFKGFELLAQRVNFVGRHRSRTSVNGSPSTTCVKWPVKNFGPTYPVARLSLSGGDVVSFNFFVRGTSPGRGPTRKLIDKAPQLEAAEVADGVAEDLLVVYTKDGHRYQQELEASGLYAFIRSNVKDVATPCHREPNIFTGDETADPQVVVFTPRPRSG